MSELSDKVATRAQTGIQPGSSTADSVASMLAANWQAIKSVIPKHVTPERLTRIAITTIKGNEKLQKCTAVSLVGAVLQCVRFGFEPNTTGECYIIPYGNQAQFQLGYIGHVQLMYRSGMVSSVGAVEVCENDECDFDYGPQSKPSVKKAKGERGEIIGYFAWVTLKSGGFIWEYMTKEEVNRHRNKFSKQASGFGWKDHYDSMARKTVLLRVMKLAPKSVEINTALFADEKIVTDPMRLEDVDAVVLPEADESEETQIESVDAETGELFNGGTK